MFSNFLIQYGVFSGDVGVALQAERVQPPCVEAPDGEAKQADAPERIGIQHRSLEVDAVRLDFVDQPGLQRRVCSVAHVV